jgi:hypothetical protein
VEELRSTFDNDGYIAIQSFLSKSEVDELRQETLRFIDEEVPKLPEDVVYCEVKGDYSTLKQIQKLNEFGNYFAALAKSDKVVCLAEELLGGPVELQNMQYFNKVPKLGKPTPPHSGTIHRANGNSSNRDCKSIGFIFYRDDVTIDQEAHEQYQHDLHETLREQEKI